MPDGVFSNLIARREGKELTLFDLASVLFKWKRLIIAVGASSFIAAIAISLLLPKAYRASASVVPPTQEAGGLGSLPAGAERTVRLLDAFTGIPSRADLWAGILASTAVKDTVIHRFDLMVKYRARTIEDARTELEGATTVRKSKEGIVSVSVEDRDPQLAASMANAYIEELDRINKNMVTTSGGRMRKFVENRLEQAKTSLAKAEDALRQFQEKNKAVSLDAQSQTVIEAIGSLKGELFAKEIRLETMLSYTTSDHPEVQVLRSEIEHIRQKLKDLEDGAVGPELAQGTTPDLAKDIFIPTEKMPALALEYGRFLRDAKMQETLYQLLSEQYELARIQEARDTPTVQTLDRAYPPTKKVKPRRTLIVVAATLIGVFVASLIALSLEYVQAHTSGEERNGNAQGVEHSDTQVRVRE